MLHSLLPSLVSLYFHLFFEICVFLNLINCHLVPSVVILIFTLFIEKKKDQGTTSYAIMSTNTTSYSRQSAHVILFLFCKLILGSPSGSIFTLFKSVSLSKLNHSLYYP